MTKPKKISATITLQDDQKFVQLLSAFFAVHNPFSHDEDCLTFTRDDGSSLRIRAAISYVEWRKGGQPNGEWTENIDIGQQKRLVMWFLSGNDESLAAFPWLSSTPQPGDEYDDDTDH